MRKLTPPRFQIGDQVYIPSHGKVGTITDIVNKGDYEDIAKQGHRYYVKIGQEVWSIPEDALRLNKKRNNNNGKLVHAPFILPPGGARTSCEPCSKEPDPETALIDKQENWRPDEK